MPNGFSQTILLVEDNPSDQELTNLALKRDRIGNDLVVASDGIEAWEYLQNNPLPQLVLLDINLPRMNGLALLQKMRAQARTRELPVIIMTSSQEDETRYEAEELGVHAYLRKPVQFREFCQALGKVGLFWVVTGPQPVGQAS